MTGFHKDWSDKGSSRFVKINKKGYQRPIDNIYQSPKEKYQNRSKDTSDKKVKFTQGLVKGLPLAITLNEINQLLDKFGKIENLEILWDQTSDDRLSTIVNYYKRKDLESMRDSLNGAELDGGVILVQIPTQETK